MSSQLSSQLAGLTYLITGASRGLGLGYARGLLNSSPSTKVVAAARNPDAAEGIQQLVKDFGPRVLPLKFDAVDLEGGKEAAKKLEESGFLGESGLDFLVVSAGVAVGPEPAVDINADEIAKNLAVNLYGSINTVKAFLPLVQKSQTKKIVFITSTLGSITTSGEIDWYPAYSISKAALNMYARKLAVELGKEGFTVFVMTDINNYEGVLTVDEAVAKALKNIFLASDIKNSEFVSQSGDRIAW